MRISDWSSDVCSSDLIGNRGRQIYKGGVNVPIGDHAAARIFGGWGKFDGTIKNERTGNYIGGYDGNYAYGINVLVEPTEDRKSVVLGKSVAVRVDLCGRRIIKKKKFP